MSILPGVVASGISGHLANPSFESIATVYPDGSNTITLSSIPSTYKHLQIRIYGRLNGTGINVSQIWIRANGDSNSNYAWHSLYGEGISANTNSTSSFSYIYFYGMPKGGTINPAYGTTVIDIIDYASTSKYKTFRSFGGVNLNETTGYSVVELASGLWQSTSAINSLSFTVPGLSWAGYSQIALYGIKG